VYKSVRVFGKARSVDGGEDDNDEGVLILLYW